jgi:hypothetical protein
MLRNTDGGAGYRRRAPMPGFFASLELLERAGFPFARNAMVQYRYWHLMSGPRQFS